MINTPYFFYIKLIIYYNVLFSQTFTFMYICLHTPTLVNYAPLVWQKTVTFNPFTPKTDQLQFSLSVSHQRYMYIIQYG